MNDIFFMLKKKKKIFVTVLISEELKVIRTKKNASNLEWQMVRRWAEFALYDRKCSRASLPR